MIHGTGEIITSPSGRQFQRHESGIGTIMEWDDSGTIRHTIILDANHRDVIPGFPKADKEFTLPSNILTGYVFGVPIDPEEINPVDFTDAILNGNDIVTQDTQSSEENTNNIKDDRFLNYSAAFCKSIVVPIEEKETSIPNIRTLVRLYADSAIIDSMDPSLNANQAYFATKDGTELGTKDDKFYMVEMLADKTHKRAHYTKTLHRLFTGCDIGMSSSWFKNTASDVNSFLCLTIDCKAVASVLQYYNCGLIPVLDMD